MKPAWPTFDEWLDRVIAERDTWTADEWLEYALARQFIACACSGPPHPGSKLCGCRLYEIIAQQVMRQRLRRQISKLGEYRNG